MSLLYGFAPDSFDPQWRVQSDLRVSRRFKPEPEKKVETFGDFVREYAIEQSYCRLLRRGAHTAKNVLSKMKGKNVADEDVASCLGVTRESVDRWRNRQAGRIDPLFYFMLFITNEPDAVGNWTKGLVTECVLACISKASKTIDQRPEATPPITILAVRFMAYCFRQNNSHYRLFGTKSGRFDAFAEYLRGFFNEDLKLAQTHKPNLSQSLTDFGYTTFAVLHHLPTRALNDVLGN